MQTYLETKSESWLIWFLRGLVILVFLIIVGRLTDLQIIKGEYYRSLAEGNRVRRVPIHAARGKILARGGEAMVGNKEVKKRILFDSQGFIKSKDLEGANADEIISEWEREYYLSDNLAHVSGYLGEASEEEVGKVKAQCPSLGPSRLGSWVGRSGIEQEYDCLLRGIDGEELIEVDTQGNKVRTLGIKKPISGGDIKTNIDFGLQEKISQLMSGKNGAVVVQDSRGEVIALYSSPSFNPNIFVQDVRGKEVELVLNDKNLPMFNRVIGGIFHPGSVFKPIVAISALEEEKIDKDFSYTDTGKIAFDTAYGSFSFSNWDYTQYGGVEGEIKLPRAIARSTDTFFYKVGEIAGVEAIDKWASKFGLDSKTGVDLPGEVDGLIPSPEWKLKVKGERWFLGNTYHISIGQGDVAITPLGLNNAITAIAAGGKVCTPSIFNSVMPTENDVGNLVSVQKVAKGDCKNLGIAKGNIELVKEGMVQACSSGGTGYTFFDFEEKHEGIKVACKTGTAEVGDGTKDTHAWFSVFAPYDDPQIIATVLVERGGEGSKVAGPIAREIFDFWFGNNK